jgi:isochorismate hydrolase
VSQSLIDRTAPKKDYITEKNIPSKTRSWIEQLHPYLSARRMDAFKYRKHDSALLIIDMQHFFLEPSSHAFLPAAKIITSNIQNLLTAFRKHELPVIFTRYAFKEDEKQGIMGRWWKRLLLETNEHSEIISSLQPQGNEIVLIKSQYSSFIGTNLDQILNELNISQVVITGVMTHLCCESTARESFMRGFEVFFVIDATATRNEDLHISSLKTLSDGFAIPKTAQEMLTCLNE